MKVKIFTNDRGEPEKLQKEINEWLEKSDAVIIDTRYSIAFDNTMDECMLSVLVLYND
jgi:hypothetical protein